VAGAGVLALTTDRGTYLGLILVWAVAGASRLQWAFGGDLLLRRWRLVAPAVALPTVYLWVADRLAIGWSIWWISPELTIGWRPFGLPVEEALFFLVTNVLVGFGLVLALHPALDGAPGRDGPRRGAGRPGGRCCAVGAAMVPTPLVPGRVRGLRLRLDRRSWRWRCWSTPAALRPGRRLLFAVAFGFGVAVEWLGAATGVPFGAYATRSRPADVGGAAAGAAGVVGVRDDRHRRRAPGRALLVAPLALVAWDLGARPAHGRAGLLVVRRRPPTTGCR
jgi:lycopene beta-cyclase